MGMRKYERSVAKYRLDELGIEKFGYGMPNSLNRRFHRTAQGKKRLAEYRKRKKPSWWSVLYGDLAKEFRKEMRRRERLAFQQKNAYRQKVSES